MGNPITPSKTVASVDVQPTAEQNAAIVAAIVGTPEPKLFGFGVPSFAWTDSAWKSKDGKTTMHATYTVPVLNTPFSMSAVIWRTIGESADGPTESFTVGLPGRQAVALTAAKDEAAIDAADSWKESVLLAFDVWQSGNGKPDGQAPRKRQAPRLVKKLTTAPTATAAK